MKSGDDFFREGKHLMVQTVEKVETTPTIKPKKKITVQGVLKLLRMLRKSPIDINILRCFYITGQDPPLDTCAWCTPVLYKKLKEDLELETDYPNFYEKVRKLEKHGLIFKLKRTNPSVYQPVEEHKYIIRKAVFTWLAKNGFKLC